MESLFCFERFLPLLEGIDEHSTLVRTNGHLKLRPLNVKDYSFGFMEVLAQLTDVGHVDMEMFKSQFERMKRTPDTYYVLVFEDTDRGKVVACASLVVEEKFIHGCAKRGRIEDLIVDENYRNRGLGTILLKMTVSMACHLGCYKVNLESEDERMRLYRAVGFTTVKNQTYMEIRFPD